MKELLAKHGLVKRVNLEGAAAGQRKSATELSLPGFVYGPSLSGRNYTRRRLRRSRKDLLTYSEAPLPSRAIRVIRNAVKSLEWGLKPKDVQKARKQKEAYDKAKQVIKSVLSRPNTTTDDLSSFLGPIVEDSLIWDAGVWEYVEKPKFVAGNDLLSLEIVPGYSMAIYAKWNGDPKIPRWIQLKDDGSVHDVFFDREIEFIMMRNRSFDPFGLSPLETAMEVMDTLTNLNSYQRQIASEAYPSMLVYLGDEIDDTQRKLFKMYWENELRGRGTPGFVGGFGTKLRPEPIPLKPNGDEGLFLQYQELQTRVLSICFDLHPQDFGVERDVNKSQGEVSAASTLKEAIKPIANEIKIKFNTHVLPRISEVSGNKEVLELEFWWMNLDPKDAQRQATIDNIYASLDSLMMDDLRARQDEEPFPNDLGKLTVTSFRTLAAMDPLILLRSKEHIQKLLNPPEPSPEEGGGLAFNTEEGQNTPPFPAPEEEDQTAEE